MPTKDDYLSASGYVPSSILKSGLRDFLDQSGLTLATVMAYCGNLVELLLSPAGSTGYTRVNSLIPAFFLSHSYKPNLFSRID